MTSFSQELSNPDNSFQIIRNSENYYQPFLFLFGSNYKSSNSFREGIRDSSVTVIIEKEVIDSISADEDSLLRNHPNLQYLIFNPFGEDVIYKRLKYIKNLKGAEDGLNNCGNCNWYVLYELENLKIINSNQFNPRRVNDAKPWPKNWNEKIIAYIDYNEQTSIFEIFPNLKYLEINPWNKYYIRNNSNRLYSHEQNNRQKKLNGNYDISKTKTYCDVVYDYWDYDSLPLEVLFYREATCYSEIQLPELPNLKKLILNNSELPLIWKNFDNNQSIKEINLKYLKIDKCIKKSRFNELIKLTMENIDKTQFINFQEQFPKAKMCKIMFSKPITSKTLEKLSQLYYLEIYGTKDRSLGFKLPKEKNSLKYLSIRGSKLWWPPKKLGDYKNLDTLILDVAFYRKKRLKKALLNLPNLKYVRITNWRTEIKDSKKMYKPHKGKLWVRNENTGELEFKNVSYSPAYNKDLYTLFEIEILDNHPNKELDLHIETKWKHERVHQH